MGHGTDGLGVHRCQRWTDTYVQKVYNEALNWRRCDHVIQECVHINRLAGTVEGPVGGDELDVASHGVGTQVAGCQAVTLLCKDIRVDQEAA